MKAFLALCYDENKSELGGKRSEPLGTVAPLSLTLTHPATSVIQPSGYSTLAVVLLEPPILRIGYVCILLLNNRPASS